MEEPISDKKFYNQLVYWISMCNFNGGFNQMFFAPFLISLTNENNFNWKFGTTEFSRNVGLTNSIFFMGMALSSASASLYLGFNLRKVLMAFSLMSMVSVLFHCFTNETLFFAGRLILGYSCGIMKSVSSIFQHHVSPTSCRGTSSYIWSLGSKLSGIFIYTLAIMDSGSSVYWRLGFCIQLIPAVTFILLGLTKFKNFDSPARIYKLGEYSKVKEMQSIYVKPEHTTFMLNNYKKLEENEKELQEQTKIKNCGSMAVIYNNYYDELKYALLFSMVHSLSSLTSYNSFYLLFAVQDKKDAGSLQWAKFNSTIMKIWLIVIGVIGVRYQINKFRKRIYVIGLFSQTLNWFLLSVFFFNESYAYTIPGGYILATLEGTCFIPFYTMILEVCGDKLYTISLCAYMLYNTCLSYVSPFLVQSPENYASYCQGTSLLVLCISIFGLFYIVETQGLEKKDVYDILRNKLTRKQALINNQNEIANIKKRQDKKKVM